MKHCFIKEAEYSISECHLFVTEYHGMPMCLALTLPVSLYSASRPPASHGVFGEGRLTLHTLTHCSHKKLHVLVT